MTRWIAGLVLAGACAGALAAEPNLEAPNVVRASTMTFLYRVIVGHEQPERA